MVLRGRRLVDDGHAHVRQMNVKFDGQLTCSPPMLDRLMAYLALPFSTPRFATEATRSPSPYASRSPPAHDLLPQWNFLVCQLSNIHGSKSTGTSRTSSHHRFVGLTGPSLPFVDLSS